MITFLLYYWHDVFVFGLDRLLYLNLGVPREHLAGHLSINVMALNFNQMNSLSVSFTANTEVIL